MNSKKLTYVIVPQSFLHCRTERVQLTIVYSMRRYLPLVLFLFLSINAPLLACSGACATDADCAGNACRYCDTEYGVCSDCCEYTEYSVCPQTACVWQYGECRNISGLSCGMSLPETPRNYRSIFFIALALATSGFVIWQVKFRKKALK